MSYIKYNHMIEVIQKYKVLKKRMSDLINKSDYKKSLIAKQIGIQPVIFSIKIKTGNWSSDEMLKILFIIENKKSENVKDNRIQNVL